jgi:hypothetical protein
VTDREKLPAALDKVLAASAAIVDKTPKHGPFGARRPARTVGLSAVITLVLFFAARSLLELDTLQAPLRVIIALVPAIAFVWLLWAFTSEIKQADELERSIQLEALAVAFPLTMILVMTLGLLQLAVPLSPDDWSYRHIWPLIYVFYLVGLVRARRRYE